MDNVTVTKRTTSQHQTPSTTTSSHKHLSRSRQRIRSKHPPLVPPSIMNSTSSASAPFDCKPLVKTAHLHTQKAITVSASRIHMRTQRAFSPTHTHRGKGFLHELRVCPSIPHPIDRNSPSTCKRACDFPAELVICLSTPSIPVLHPLSLTLHTRAAKREEYSSSAAAGEEVGMCVPLVSQTHCHQARTHNMQFRGLV